MLLAPALTEREAHETLEALLAAQERIETPSMHTDLASHPNRHFARSRIKAPDEHDLVRAWALEAALALAYQAGRLEEHAETVTTALDDVPAVRATALRAARRWPALSAVDFARFLADDDPEVRGPALRACLEDHLLDDGDARLEAMIAPDAPLPHRCVALAVARDRPISCQRR